MAKNNGKASGKATKKEPVNWAKIVVPLLMVFIMVGSIFAYMSSKPQTTTTSNPENSFNNVTDGLKLIPASVSNARYIDLANDTVLASYMSSNAVLSHTLPPSSVFNADPKQDMLAIYPSGYFGDFAEQFVSLTSFGSRAINSSWPAYTVNGQIVEAVNAKYFYTLNTKPVISGRVENVASTLNATLGATSNSYGEYADLFQELKWKQIYTDNATLQVVGKSSNYTIVDRYYAAVAPVDPGNTSADRLYTYTAIMHVNNSTDRDRQDLALLGDTMTKMGFKAYNVEVYDDYIVIEAKGNLGMVMDDMLYRWSFLKYRLQA